MKNLFSITAILLIVLSCQTKPDKSVMVLEYLQEHTNGIEYYIVEISEPDSLYSPFELINSLMLAKSTRYNELSKQLLDSYNLPSLKERKAVALEIAELAYAEYTKNHNEFSSIVNSITSPFFGNIAVNRVAYKVKYKVDGLMQEDIFYLEYSGDAIAYTASELKTMYLKLCDENGKLYSLVKDAKEAAMVIR